MDPLQDLLTQLHNEGASVGHGKFTLDTAAAEGRIGLENRPGLYLLKLVQTAVASQCQEISLKIGKDLVRVEAPGGTDFSRADVEQALRGPFSSQPGPALQHLAWACLLARPYRNLQISTPSGTFDSRWGWSEVARPSGFSLLLERHQGLLQWLLPHKHEILYAHCAYAPIPVRLDGRCVNAPDRIDRWHPDGVYKCPNWFQFSWLYELCEVLVERNLLVEAGPRLLASLPTTRTVRHLQMDERHWTVLEKTLNHNFSDSKVNAVHLCEWLSPQGRYWPVQRSDRPTPDQYPLARASSILGLETAVLSVPIQEMLPYSSSVPASLGWNYSKEPTSVNAKTQNFARMLPLVSTRITLPLGLEGPGYLIPILHGVALEKVSVDFPGLLALVADDDWTTDLSHLKVVHNQVVEQARSKVLAATAQMLENVKFRLKPHYPEWVCEEIFRRLAAKRFGPL